MTKSKIAQTEAELKSGKYKYVDAGVIEKREQRRSKRQKAERDYYTDLGRQARPLVVGAIVLTTILCVIGGLS